MMHKDPGRTDLCTKSLCTKNCVRRTSVQKDLHERMYDHVLSCRFLSWFEKTPRLCRQRVLRKLSWHNPDQDQCWGVDR